MIYCVQSILDLEVPQSFHHADHDFITNLQHFSTYNLKRLKKKS